MKLNVGAFAIATAGACVLAYLAGAALDAVSSWGGAALVSFVFRVDVVELTQPLTLGSLLTGLATCALFGAMMGGFVAWAYNGLTRSARAPAAASVVAR